MKKQVLISSLLFAETFAFGQKEYVKQYFFTSGGIFKSPNNSVGIGTIKNGQVNYIDSVNGDFSNFVHIYYNPTLERYEGIAHIGRASNKDLLVRYDLDTYKAIDSTTSSGVKAIARNEDKIVVAKWYGSSGQKVDLLDANTLALVDSFPEIQNNCLDVKVLGNFAYVAHSDGLSGYLSVIDLKTATVDITYDLGTKAMGISNLLAQPSSNDIPTLYFSGGSDTTYYFKELTIYSKSGLHVVASTNENVFGLELTTPTLSTVKTGRTLLNMEEGQGIKNEGEFDYDLFAQYDTVNNVYLVLKPQYTETSWLMLFSAGGEQDSLPLKPSSTGIGIDYRPNMTTSLFSSSLHSSSAKIFPNPCKDVLMIGIQGDKINSVQISGIDGKIIESFDVSATSEFLISTARYEKGVYFISLQTGEKQQIAKFIKE